MIFDKRFVMATALVLGFGMAACGGDEDCSGNGTKGEDGKCVCNEGYEANEAGDDCVVKEDNGEDEGEGEGEGNGEGEGEGNGEGDGNGDGETITCGENEKPSDDGKSCWCADGYEKQSNVKASEGKCMLKPDASLCGNGEIDENEICDTGANPDASDDVMGDATCASLIGEWKEGGAPACASNCFGYKYGTCEEVGTEENPDDVNSVVSCDATVTYDAETKVANGKATVVSKDNLPVKGTVICAQTSQGLEALVANATLADATDGNLEATYDSSAHTDAGEYGCVVYVQVEESKGVFCTAEGLKELNAVANIGEIALANYTVESQVAADTIAKWTFATATKDGFKDAAIAGIAPDEGADKDLKLTWVPVGENGASIEITLTADNSGTQGSLTAFQVKPGAAEKLGNTQIAAESSHISINDLSVYAITSLSMTARYTGKLYITEVTDSAETLIKTFEDMTKEYAVKEVTGFSANASAINIYGDNTISGALSIDDLTLVGTK